MEWLNIGLAKKNATSICTWCWSSKSCTDGKWLIYSSMENVEPKKVPYWTKVSWHCKYKKGY